MTTFGTILGKLFGSATAAPAPSGPPPSATSTPTSTSTSTGTAPAPTVDVPQRLQALSDQGGQGLQWQTSIVDLLKLLGLDSSFASRQTLARELGYTGDPDDSAAMNTWLHPEVMRRLAANGGEVPTELKG